MSSEAVPRPDRRHLRRAETIAEIVDVALEVMAVHGVAGLSLGEVARRMGIRPPSLYVYFDSKNAVYDAVFARGWREILAAVEEVEYPDSTTADLAAYLLRSGEAFVRWAVEHPVHTQLMGWRPVPGYVPSAEAYADAQTSWDRNHGVFVRLQELGLLTSDVGIDEIFRAWTIVTSGVITQQLANAPGAPYAAGSFTSMLPEMVAMFCAHYGSPRPRTRTSATSRRAEAVRKTAPPRRGRHADHS